MGSKFSIIESEVQKARKTNGTKFEKMIMSKASNDWIVLKSEDVIRDLTTTKMWNCDVVNHKQKIFLELTTSVKDGKESKIINESKTYKHHYPEYKFVVGIEKIHNPRKRDNLDAHIDHLKQTPTIDSVLIGKDEILKFMNKPKFKKQNKRRMNRMNNNALLMETLLHGAKNGDSNGVKSLLNIFGVKEQRKTTKTNNKKRRSEVKKQEWFRENLMNLIHCENEETQSLGDLSKEWWGKSQASRFFSSLAATKAKEDRVKLFGNPNGYPSSWRIKTSDSLKYSKYVK